MIGQKLQITYKVVIALNCQVCLQEAQRRGWSGCFNGILRLDFSQHPHMGTQSAPFLPPESYHFTVVEIFGAVLVFMDCKRTG
jgi:hypothetical protein